MTDVLNPDQRSYCMSKIRGNDTLPEIQLRKALWRLGVRYRLQGKLPGKPDLYIRSRCTVVFVDGCFWHGCPEHSVRPKSNAEFWDRKIGKNIDRDRRVNDELLTAGWYVIRVWEHEIKADPVAAAERVRAEIYGGNPRRE